MRGDVRAALRFGHGLMALVMALTAGGASAQGRTTEQGEWLAGDLHVHTCYSHDAYCPDDDNTDIDEIYTMSTDVRIRFVEAFLRGLDYLAITDHNDVRSVRHPGFGSFGVIGIPGYEKSIKGHAQMLGTRRIHDPGDGEAGDVQAMANRLRAAGGVFQANHPTIGLLEPLDEECNDVSELDWGYGFDVVPDTLEVWNISHLFQPPLPSASSTDDAVRYWECWLQRGHRIGATGGSDSHWLSTTAIQGPGNPTTWVYAEQHSARGVLEALRAGRTTISVFPPLLGGPKLLLEADSNDTGYYDAMIGDEVSPGSPMRIRTEGMAGVGLLQVRANGRTILDGVPIVPGQPVHFRAPKESGWVRATLQAPDGKAQRGMLCDGLLGGETTYCRNRLTILAMTSPIYLR